MSANLETELTAVKAAVQQVLGELQSHAEKVSKGMPLAADAKEAVDKALVQQVELNARLAATEQRIAKLDGKVGQSHEERVMSLGEHVTESDEFKAFMQDGGLRGPKASWGKVIKAAITSLGTGGNLVQRDRVRDTLQLPERRLTVRDLIAPGQTDSNAIEYVRETSLTNNAATVSEGVTKPESDIAYSLVTGNVVTIAHWIKASKQILSDVPALRSMIDGRLRYMLSLVEENQLLKGSGSGNNLNGIYTQAAAYSAPIDPPGTETVMDVIRLMLLQAELTDIPPDGIVMHPSDWASIELSKDSTGQYIFANPQRLQTPVLWGRPVVATTAMTVDTALVGPFRTGAQIFDREDVSVLIATENQDDFIKNMITILCEERLALAVYRPGSFIKNTNLP